MPFEIRISKRAEKELSKIAQKGQKDIVERIVKSIEQLSRNPFKPRPGADILQLKAVDPKLYRLRVGKFRVLYSVDEKKRVVNITMVLHRKKAYR